MARRTTPEQGSDSFRIQEFRGNARPRIGPDGPPVSSVSGCGIHIQCSRAGGTIPPDAESIGHALTHKLRLICLSGRIGLEVTEKACQ